MVVLERNIGICRRILKCLFAYFDLGIYFKKVILDVENFLWMKMFNVYIIAKYYSIFLILEEWCNGLNYVF